MNAIAALLLLLLVPFSGQSQTLEQLDASVPSDWWSESGNHMDGLWVKDGVVFAVSERKDRLILEGPGFQVTEETVFINSNFWSNDPSEFDGRELSLDEFAKRIEAGEAPDLVTVWSLPLSDGSAIAQRAQYGISPEPTDRAFHFGRIEHDDAGGTILRALGEHWELAGEVGDENGDPIVDLFGALLQVEKFPQAGDRVRLLLHNGTVLRIVRDPPLIGEPHHGSTFLERRIIGEILLDRRALRLQGPVVVVGAHTEFYSERGLGIDRNAFADRLKPGDPIQVEGEYRGQLFHARSIDLLQDIHESRAFREGNFWRFYAGKFEVAAGALRTLEQHYTQVAADAPLVDVETDAGISFQDLLPGMSVRIERLHCTDPRHTPTAELRSKHFCDIVVAVDANVPIDADVEIYHEWNRGGIVARIEDSFVGRELVLQGPIVRWDRLTEITTGDGFPADLDELHPGQKVYLEIVPTSDPLVALARKLQMWNPQLGYDDGPGSAIGTIDAVEEDLIYLEGERFSLPAEVVVKDEEGEELKTQQLKGGTYVELRIQDTSVGRRTTQIRIRHRDPHFQPQREEEVQLFDIANDGRLILAGPRMTLVPRPAGSTRGTELIGRHGEELSFTEFSAEIERSRDVKLIAVNRTSRTSGLEVALVVRIYNHQVPWEEQVPDGAEVGYLGWLDGDQLQLVDRDRWLHLAVDASVSRDGELSPVESVVPGSTVRISIASVPSGYARFFGDIVTHIEVATGSIANESRSGAIQGVIEEIDYKGRSFALRGTEFRYDPFITTVLASNGERVSIDELSSGDMLAIESVPGEIPTATQIVVVGEENVRFGAEMAIGRLRSYHGGDRLLSVEGERFEVPESVEIYNVDGRQVTLADLRPGNRVSVHVDGSSVSIARRIEIKYESEEDSGLRVVSAVLTSGSKEDLYNIDVEFSEPLVVRRSYVAVDMALHPRPPAGDLLGYLNATRDMEEGNRRIVLRDVPLDPQQTYQLSVLSARSSSGRELRQPVHLLLGNQPPASELANFAGSISLHGDEIADASVLLFDPSRDILQVIAGTNVEPSGRFRFAGLVPGSYSAFAQIETAGGVSLLEFFDADGDGERDIITVRSDAEVDLEYEFWIDRAVPATPAGQGTASIDLDPAAGNQFVSDHTVRPGETVRLALYGSGLQELTGVSAVVRFDTLQLSFERVSDGTEDELHLLRSRRGAIPLFLPPRLVADEVQFGGAILSPTNNTAATGDGLLGVFDFTVLDGFTGTRIELEELVLSGLGGTRDTLDINATAVLQAPTVAPQVSSSRFSFDLNPNAGDDQVPELGDIQAGDRFEVAIYINDANSIANYSVEIAYDNEQLEYLEYSINGANEPPFLSSAGGRIVALPPIVESGSLEFGNALLGPSADEAPSGSGMVAVLTFAATARFSETELTIVDYSTRSFDGRNETLATPIVARLTNRSLGAIAKVDADFDDDQRVDFNDFFMFADAFGRPDFDPVFDLDGNGAVEFGDFFLFADHFGQSAGKAIAEDHLVSVPGALVLSGKRSGDEFSLELHSQEMQPQAFQAVIRYDADRFKLLPNDLFHEEENLLMMFPVDGEVHILGGQTGGRAYPSSMLAQLRFMPISATSSGNFFVETATVRFIDGTIGQPERLGAQRVQVLPAEFSLEPNFPNPFNPTTSIRYNVEEDAGVTLEVFNSVGQRIRTLVDGAHRPGSYAVEWDGLDQHRTAVAAGLYFYRLRAGDQVQTRKMILAK